MIELINVKAKTINKAIDIPYLILPTVGMVAFIGPKDSGKSLLLKTIAGINNYKGKIIINQGLKHKKYTCNIGYLDFSSNRRYEADNYIKALENTAKIYGIKNINKAIENSSKYLRAFDLTKNDNYDKLDQPRKALFSLSILLALELPVILLDELYLALDKKYESKVETILTEYANKHLVVVSLSIAPKLELYNDIFLIKNGIIIKEANTKQEKFKSVIYRKNKNFDLGTFSILPHLATRAKVFIIFLSVIFTFIIASLSESLNPNLTAVHSLFNVNFVSVSKIYSKYESSTFYDFRNNKITIESDNGKANDFAIRPLINNNSTENKIKLSTSVASFLNVSKGDKVKIATKEFIVENIISNSNKEIFVSYTYYCLLGNNTQSTYYYLLNTDVKDCIFFNQAKEEIEFDSSLKYFNFNITNIDSHETNYGFYKIKNYEDNNLVLISENDNIDKPLNISTDYVLYFTKLNTLKDVAKSEDKDFVYNKIKPDSRIVISYVISVSLYLVMVTIVFIRADKDDSDYYKCFSKQKYVFLQSLKFFSFLGIILLCTLILVSTLSRENILLALTLIVLLITLLLFLLIYILLGKFSIKDE